jgi:tetratricopeptide (TPR) repeat protein
MHAETALAAYQALGDGVATNKVLNNLGGIHFLLGAHDAAIDCLTESVRIARSLGDAVGTGFALSTLAETLRRTGDAAAAEDFAGQALAELEAAGELEALLAREGLDEAVGL